MFSGERCTSGKKSKERVTVLVGANMSGSEKLPLLVIGKSANPRAFKNKEVPVAYKANKKAWMSGRIFSCLIVYARVFQPISLNRGLRTGTAS